jgi:arsenate reductase
MNVLFLCTGNSARSILAEAILNAKGGGRFTGYSAGSHPHGEVHPLALAVLETCSIPTAGLTSKSWEVFNRDQAPHMHVVITVCDQAAEACLLWPGAPISARWGLPDPAAVTGSDTERMAAFAVAFTSLERHIDLLIALPMDFLSPDELEQQLRAIA